MAQRDDRAQWGSSAFRTARNARRNARRNRMLLRLGGGGFVAMLAFSVLIVHVAGTVIGGAEAEGELGACGVAQEPVEVADGGRTLDSREIARLAANAGFAGEDLAVAVAVAFAESGGDVSVTNTNNNGSTDYGLWQINSVHEESGFDPSRYADPNYNAMWAYRIYEAAGKRWDPWVAYTNGAYREPLAEAQAAVEEIGPVLVDGPARDTGSDVTGMGECSSETPATVQGFGRSQSVGAGPATAIAFARQQIGDPYQWGAIGPNSWDCSSLVQAAWAAAGVRLPRVSRDQFAAVTPVPRFDIHPGDLIFYDHGGPVVRHVVMYTGDGKIIEAPSAGLTVRERSVYWTGVRGVGRPAV